MMLKKLLSICVCLAVGLSALAEEKAAQKIDPAVLIKEARKNASRLSYRAELLRDGFKSFIYNKANPDGTSYYRIDSYIDGVLTELENRDGIFCFVDDGRDGITKYHTRMSGFFIYDYSDKSASYKIKECRFRGKNCYKITKKTKLTKSKFKKFYADRKNKFMQPLKEAKIDFKKLYPVVLTYYIQKKPEFILKEVGYNTFGKRIESLTNIVKVDFDYDFGDELFTLPKGGNVYVAKDFKSLRQEQLNIFKRNEKRKAELKKTSTKQTSLLKNGAEQTENSYISWSTLFFYGGIFLLLVAAIIKVKKKLMLHKATQLQTNKQIKRRNKK